MPEKLHLGAMSVLDETELAAVVVPSRLCLGSIIAVTLFELTARGTSTAGSLRNAVIRSKTQAE